MIDSTNLTAMAIAKDWYDESIRKVCGDFIISVLMYSNNIIVLSSNLNLKLTPSLNVINHKKPYSGPNTLKSQNEKRPCPKDKKNTEKFITTIIHSCLLTLRS